MLLLMNPFSIFPQLALIFFVNAYERESRNEGIINKVSDGNSKRRLSADDDGCALYFPIIFRVNHFCFNPRIHRAELFFERLIKIIIGMGNFRVKIPFSEK